jgi:uncharacterized membrane protein YphA (DoxX/SURF4 family)
MSTPDRVARSARSAQATSASRTARQCGISLIELIMFIIIVSIGVTALLAVFTTTTRKSADPMIQKQMLAIGIGTFEVIAGLMIALNFLARFFAILLIIFVMVATFYFHDFWNQTPPDNAKTLIEALKNLSLIGALFIIAGYGKGPRSVEPAYGDV